MVGGLGVKNPNVRPPLPRSRSHTLPSSTNIRTDQDREVEHTLPPSRPTHGRSHSYLSPAERKPRNANTLPAEKTSSRLHLPRSSKHGGEHRHFRYRHTQSQAEQHQHTSANNEANSKLPHLVAGLAAEREKRAHLERPGTNASDLRTVRTNEIKRVTSHKTGSGAPKDGTHSRGISDPRTPAAAPVRKTSTELLLDRADARKAARWSAVTSQDVEIMKQKQEVADAELRERLADVNTTSSEVMRRLDYTYYSLLEKLGNLVGTVRSFQNLSTQSHHLITNFEHETSKLDGDIKRRIKKFRAGFDEREGRIAELERRGNTASVKARELGTRLQNAGVIVGNWENRERATKRKWGRFWGGLWWTLALLSILIVGVVIGKEWWFRGDPVAAGLQLSQDGARNRSWALNRDRLSKLHVPAEVKVVLENVEERRRKKKIWPRIPELHEDDTGRRKDAETLRVLDEL